MTLELDDRRRAAAEAQHRGDTVTMLQDAAGSGHPVMFPGTRESRAVAPSQEPRMPAGGYVHGTTPTSPEHTGPIGRLVIWLVDRLIALLRTAPAR